MWWQRDLRESAAGCDEKHQLEKLRAAAHALSGTGPLNVYGVNSYTGSPKAVAAASLDDAETFGPGGADPVAMLHAAVGHLRTIAPALGFEANGAASLDFAPDPVVQVTSAGSHIVHCHQHYLGIPVFQMSRAVHFSPRNRIARVTGDNALLPRAIDVFPRLSPEVAAKTAAAFLEDSLSKADSFKDHWGGDQVPQPIPAAGYEPKAITEFPLPNRPTLLEGGPFGHPVPVYLTIFGSGENARLGWNVTFTFPDLEDQYALVVAADTQEAPDVLFSMETMQSVAGRGLVFLESPARGERVMVPFPLPMESYPLPQTLPDPTFPADWISEDSTVGNNAEATLRDTMSALQGRLEGGQVVFEPVDEAGDEQKVLNIFYFCNYMHNFFYMLGFDEVAGNFQKENFSGIGAGGDAVDARAHSGAVMGTANMLTLPDGRAPVMNMGLVTSTNRHTAVDADVVFHEYVHGVTNRLVGGRMNVNALRAPQSGGMGEGWGDYFALTIQSYGKDTEKVLMGDWIVGNGRGIRQFPYDSNFPDSFADLGTGRYRSSVHNIGEIWCATLMEMTRLVGRIAGSRDMGYQICWQVVVDALKLTPATPSFLDARDGILQAVKDLHEAGRLPDNMFTGIIAAVWTAFAKFGMGPKANSRGASVIVTAADFEVPEDVTPIPTENEPTA